MTLTDDIPIVIALLGLGFAAGFLVAFDIRLYIFMLNLLRRLKIRWFPR